MGTQETRVCDKEDDSTEPCAVRGEQCGRNGQGNCVAKGICCNAGLYNHLYKYSFYCSTSFNLKNFDFFIFY